MVLHLSLVLENFKRISIYSLVLFYREYRCVRLYVYVYLCMLLV
jgi:hypothetical protein